MPGGALIDSLTDALAADPKLTRVFTALEELCSCGDDLPS